MIRQDVQVVSDSGIFLASVLQEPYSRQADALIKLWNKQHVQVAAPTLFRYEVIATVRKHVYRGNLTPATASKVLTNLQSLLTGITFMVDEQLLQRGYELAEHFNRPTAYDSQYLAVAERRGCDFWTADERLFNAVKQERTWVHWLGSFGSTSSVEKHEDDG